MQDAFDRLDRQCVMGAGFRLPASPSASLPVPEDEAAAIDLDGRRRHGYGISVHDHGSTAAVAPDAYMSSLSVRDQRRLGEAQFGPGEQRTAVTLNGKGRVTVPAAGCIARSRTTLAGDVQTFAKIFYAPQQFDDQLNRTALKDELPIDTRPVARLYGTQGVHLRESGRRDSPTPAGVRAESKKF